MTVGMHLALVVEDDRGVQKVLRMMLEANGFRVVIADSCARGERDARSQRPDVSIVDLGLPDLDGIELIKSIRTWSPMPIIVLSARTAEAQRLAAFEAGADDYVLKPFSRTRVGDISTQPSSLHPPMLTPRPSTQRISICSHRISISSQSSRQRGSPLDGHHRFVFSNNGELHVQCRCN